MRLTARPIVLACGFAVFVAVHITVKVMTAPAESGVSRRIGQVATSFDGATLDGTPFHLATYAQAHRLTIVNFWEVWCAPCLVEMPALNALYARHKEEGLGLVGVFMASEPGSVRELIADRSLAFLMVHTMDEQAVRGFAVNVVPTTVVLDANLRVLRSTEGIDAGLDRFVKDYLARHKDAT